MAQTVKRLSTMWETQVRSLGREDPLEKEMAVHSSTIAWKIPHDNEGRNWSDKALIQGIARIAGNHQEIGDWNGTESPSEPPEGANLVGTLI